MNDMISFWTSVHLLTLPSFSGFHKEYKFPPKCQSNCQYSLKMEEMANGYINFHVSFKGSNYIQIGLADKKGKVQK